MLIYQATYPRCGAAFLRDLISINFGYLSGNGYESDHTFPEKWDVTPLEAEPALQTYRRPGVDERQLLLRHGALKALTPELRERLAADPRLLFVKTHELPPETAFPGEVAIQFVRHPGPTLVSYWRLQNVKKPVDLDGVIEGESMFGSWTSYHLAWEQAPLPVLRLRYEDVLSDQDAAIRTMADFLGLPTPWRIRHMPISAATSRNPTRNPGEGLDGWRHRTTLAQRREIWRRHGSLAYRYGYTPFPGASSVKRSVRFTSPTS